MPFGGRGDARHVLRRGERGVKRAGEGERSGTKPDRTGAGWNEGRPAVDCWNVSRAGGFSGRGGFPGERCSWPADFRANDVPGRRISGRGGFSGCAGGGGRVGRGGRSRSPRAGGPDGKGRGLSVVSGGTAGCLRWVSPHPLGYCLSGLFCPLQKKTGGRPCGRPPVSCRTGTVSGCGRRSRPYSYCPDLRRSTSSRVRKRHWPRLRFFFVRPA